MKIATIGLGKMGANMTERLLAGGHAVTFESGGQGKETATPGGVGA